MPITKRKNACLGDPRDQSTQPTKRNNACLDDPYDQPTQPTKRNDACLDDSCDQPTQPTQEKTTNDFSSAQTNSKKRFIKEQYESLQNKKTKFEEATKLEEEAFVIVFGQRLNATWKRAIYYNFLNYWFKV